MNQAERFIAAPIEHAMLSARRPARLPTTRESEEQSTTPCIFMLALVQFGHPCKVVPALVEFVAARV